MAKGYDHTEAELRWRTEWDAQGIYRWDPSAPRENTFVVDTPPPTVSGSLHVGHIFSYTQTDILVRFQRMRGKATFYPIGWDDNGLPTERRVQNYYAIRCNPHLPYDPNWQPKMAAKDQAVIEVSRQNFIEACTALTHEDEAAFERLFRRMGMSYDWSLTYSTIDAHCRAVSQRSFLDLVEKGLAYNTEAPTLWDVTFNSAVAQAEVEDREAAGAFHDIEFGVEGGGSFTISTTRPELLGSCIGVVAHPDDERYKPLFGRTALTPLFSAPVPIEPSPHADPEKGTGIMMVCTFGDVMDVQWWKRTGAPLKQLIGRDGRMLQREYGAGVFTSRNPARASAVYNQIAGLTIKAARKRIVELLSEPGSAVHGDGAALKGEPRPIMHPVKFYEKGDLPLEIIPSRQWYARILDHKAALLEQGRKVTWHPSHMLSRYEHWVEGLNQDWCLSRQRYFGVPFPVWYPVGSDGEPVYDRPIFAAADRLPVDPLTDCPPGYDEHQRGIPGGFIGDPDVMDTWATSSMTPQIQSHWAIDADRHRRLFPMDLRPQAHDIIRTWAFYTIVKAWMHEGEVPWRHAAISGFIVDPDRKKMSKSKGNVVTPEALIDEHSADAVRYWAARARLGLDTIFEEALFKIGRKLSTKVFNAGSFVIMQLERVGSVGAEVRPDLITVDLDRAMIATLRGVVRRATTEFEDFEYTAALHAAEEFFWNYCDHYLELVKVRAYQDESSPEQVSAIHSLALSFNMILRLLAPFVPFVTEEVWAALCPNRGSIHRAPWPALPELEAIPMPSHEEAYGLAIETIGKLRGAKSTAKRSLRWPISALTVRGSQENLAALQSVFEDIAKAGTVAPDTVVFVDGDPQDGGAFDITVTLAEQNDPA